VVSSYHAEWRPFCDNQPIVPASLAILISRSLETRHFNIWQANAGTPGFGRRVHGVHYSFSFTTTLVDFTSMGYPLNVNIVQDSREWG
jgi:hypothetical protein